MGSSNSTGHHAGSPSAQSPANPSKGQSESAEVLLRQKIIFIDHDDDLARYCEKWLSSRLIAVDTEFMRVNTYYPLAALVQVNDGEHNYLIDPLKITQWEPFARVMQSDAVIKAFHACSEDLDVFNRLLGCVPQKLFDTQVAAGLLGIAAGMGYGNLVRECLGVDLPKGETRSQWLDRPLSKGQIIYAALDVDYLFELANYLEKQLQQLERESWLYEDCLALIQQYRNNLNPASGFFKSNNTWRLKPHQLVPAKKLFEWREKTAQTKDTPKTRIIKDAQIFDVVMRQAQSLSDLKHIGLHDAAIRRYGRDILEVLNADYADDPDAIPSSKPLTKPQREYVKTFKDWAVELGEKHTITPEVVLRKTEYHAIARQMHEQKTMVESCIAVTHGWRRDFFTSV